MTPRDRMRRATLVAGLVFFLCDLVVLGPGWAAHGLDAVPGAFERDAGLQFAPWRAFTRRAVLQGELPEWNPHLFAGSPFLGTPQSALFYPPNTALLPLRVPLAMMLGRLLHLLVAQLGTWLLVRRLGGGNLGGLLAGLAFTLGSQFVLRIDAGHVCQLDAQAWLPWVVLAAVLVVEGDLRRGLALGIVASALQISAGYPQIVQVTWFALATLTPALAWSRGLSRPVALRRCAALFLGVPPAAALLSAATLLPAFELLAHSARSGFDPAWVGMLSFSPESALTLIAPGLFGGGAAPYWGRGYPWELTLYVGVVPLVLLVWGAGSDRRRALPWLVTIAWLLFLGLGKHNPLFLPLAERVPGLGIFRGPVKYMIPLTLCLAVLAGLGLTAAARPGPGSADRRRLLVAVGVALLGALTLAALGPTTAQAWIEGIARTGEHFGPPPADGPELAAAAFAGARRALVGGLLWVAAAAGLLLLRRAGRIAPSRAARALVALALLDLLAFGHGRVAFFTPSRYDLDPGLHAAVSDGAPARIALLTGEELNRPMAVGLHTLSGYVAILTARTNDYYNAWGGHDPDLKRFVRGVARVDPVSRLLNQRFLVVPRGTKLPASWRVEPRLRPVVRLAGADVYRDPGALPRAFVVEQARVVADRKRLLSAVMAQGFDPRREVLLERPPAPPPSLPASAATAWGADVVAYGSDEVRVRARLPAAGFLVLSDAHYPGWTAEVDGVEVPIQHAYGLLRAVHLPAGEREVVFRFRSAPARWGLLLAALAAAALAAVGVRARAR